MKNIITAAIKFSFKGKNLSPSITIELDSYLANGCNFPNICQLIAKHNNFDLYSYEYEMMQAQEIIYSNAQGLISEFISDGVLNMSAFETAWNENNALEKLLIIAKQHMDITDLNQHTGLKKALLEAFALGKKEAGLNNQTSETIGELF
jgi:hypothetical protein